MSPSIGHRHIIYSAPGNFCLLSLVYFYFVCVCVCVCVFTLTGWGVLVISEEFLWIMEIVGYRDEA